MNSKAVWWGILICWGVGSAIGVLSIGLSKGGFLTLTDVGDLPELKAVQAQLKAARCL